jgi:hypothetical protein
MSNPHDDVSIIVVVEEGGALDIQNANLVPAPLLLDSPRVFTLEALCSMRPELDGFAILPATSSQIHLRALLGTLLRDGAQTIELAPSSNTFAFELCRGLSSEKISVRDKSHLPRIDPTHSIPFRVHKALEVRRKLDLSNFLDGLRINQWIPARRRTSSISLAKAIGKDTPVHIDVRKLISPSPIPDETGAYLSASSKEFDHPATALAAHSKTLFLSSLHVEDEDLAFNIQHKAATLLFEAYESVRGAGRSSWFGDTAIFEQLWMREWYDAASARYALDHLAGLWVDAPSYRGQSYALLVLQLEDSHSGMVPPFLNYLPATSAISKLMARVFDAEVFIDSRSQSAREYIGHEPKDQVANVFKFFEYSVAEKLGKPLRDPPAERAVTTKPPFRPGAFNFICSLKFSDRQKAVNAIRGVHRGSAGALENTLLALLNTTLRDWGAKLDLESVKVRPFTHLADRNWQFSWGWPRLDPQTSLGAI